MPRARARARARRTQDAKPSSRQRRGRECESKMRFSLKAHGKSVVDCMAMAMQSTSDLHGQPWQRLATAMGSKWHPMASPGFPTAMGSKWRPWHPLGCPWPCMASPWPWAASGTPWHPIGPQAMAAQNFKKRLIMNIAYLWFGLFINKRFSFQEKARGKAFN